MGTLTATQTPAQFAPQWGITTLKLFETSGSTPFLVSGSVHATRIAKNATSTYAVHYYVSAATGDILLDIDLSMMDALTLGFSQPVAPAHIVKETIDAPFDITLTNRGTLAATTVVWYRNGDPIVGSLNADPITINPGTELPGSFTISYTVFTQEADGARHGGSESFNVSVQAVDPLSRIISGAANSTQDNTYTILLVKASDLSIVSTSLGVDGVNLFSTPFSFAGVLPGTYKLLAYRDGIVVDEIWHSTEDGPRCYFGGGTGTTITVPIVPGTIFNITVTGG